MNVDRRGYTINQMNVDPPVADADLVEQIALAEPHVASQQFGELHDRYARLMLSFCSSHVGAHQAEDLAQVAWQRVWTAIRQGRYDGTNFRALLLRIAKNLIVDNWRKKKLEPEQKEQLDRFEDNASQSPATHLLHEERMERLRHCLQELRAAHQSRATVAEMKVAMASVTEICAELGIDRNRVDKLWFEARRALQACVSRGET